MAFVAAHLGGYLVLYSSYAPISAGNRLILSEWLPLTTILAALADRTATGKWSLHLRGRTVRLWLGFCLVVLGSLLGELPDILTSRAATL